TLDGVMKKVAQHYEEEIDRKLSGIIAALEPTLVAILSVIVGMILLSVMLPLMGVMSAIG
ncbi:MAG: type II secretion system F family protein, partial [Christensenella hongkongensis]